MADTDVVMIVASDIAGQLRGKGAPRAQLEKRREYGVAWTPTNVLITSFGPIAPSPFGALGDLYIRPDRSTFVDLDRPEFGLKERFVIGDILRLDGEPWECCVRGRLRAALDRLRERHGLSLLASFEHEFHYSGAEAQPGLGYALRAFRRLGEFPDRLTAVLQAAGLELDTFMPEYGPGQCEMTIGPKPALRAADEAAILRELVRAAARGLGARASFAPILDPAGVGNGVHIHFSLYDAEGRAVSHDSGRPHGLSREAAAFLGGAARRMSEYIALTAPGVCSYYRLTPHRWSAAFNNLGAQDREAGLRICPVFGTAERMAERFHFEFRGGDAAASPYLALAALVEAGLEGLDDDLPAPTVTTEDLADASPERLAELGVEPLPKSLGDALERLAASGWARRAFGETFIDVYLRHKRAEIEIMQDLTPEEICARYARAY